MTGAEKACDVCCVDLRVYVGCVRVSHGFAPLICPSRRLINASRSGDVVCTICCVAACALLSGLPDGCRVRRVTPGITEEATNEGGSAREAGDAGEGEGDGEACGDGACALSL